MFKQTRKHSTTSYTLTVTARQGVCPPGRQSVLSDCTGSQKGKQSVKSNPIPLSQYSIRIMNCTLYMHDVHSLSLSLGKQLTL